MATRRNLDDQDSSITSRASEVFSESPTSGPSKAFAEILNQTPPTPLSLEMRALLWIVGFIIVMLFFAALIRVQKGSRRPRPVPAPAQSSTRPFEVGGSSRATASRCSRPPAWTLMIATELAPV